MTGEANGSSTPHIQARREGISFRTIEVTTPMHRRNTTSAINRGATKGFSEWMRRPGSEYRI